MRAVHASTKHRMAPAMRYLMSLLRPWLDSSPFLLRDSNHFINRIQKIKISDEAILVKADIKEFFMSGLHTEIIQHSSKVVEQDRRHIYIELLSCLLRNQFVCADDAAAEVAKVLIGSGMGLACSGHVSNAAFWSSVESGYIDSDIHTIPAGLTFYGRFMDDLLLVLDGERSARQEFLRQFRLKSKVFEIKFEAIAKECSFLDVSLHRGEGWKRTGYLDREVFTKPSSLWIPLGVHSWHPASIHTSWPASQIDRFQRICSSKRASKETTDRFTQMIWHCNGIDISRPSFTSGSRSAVKSRLILPYRMAWARAGFQSLCRSLAEKWQRVFAGTMLQGFQEVGMCWRLASAHLVHSLHGLNSHWHATNADLILRR